MVGEFPEDPSQVPCNAQTYVYLGDIARDGCRWDEAREAYAKALDLNPTLSEIWVQYGHALKETSFTDAAEGAYKKALHLNPDVADTHLQLGHLLKIKGRRREAVTAYCEALARDHSMRDARAELRFLAHDKELALFVRQSAAAVGLDLDKQFRCVILGTMGMCNASCIHCPANKPVTGHVPKTPMPMWLFDKIVGSLAEDEYDVGVQVSFGLFGDGLLDPHVEERARKLRKALPLVRLSVNTNAAAYNQARHAPLADYVSMIAVHVESLHPETYDALMLPLRFNRVFPKIEQILRDFPGKVAISIPANRLNMHELSVMRERFLEWGAIYVSFDRLSNRCSRDRQVFDSLSLGAKRGRCNGSALDDLIVDCDGKVLVCCNDFERLEPVGDFTTESLLEIVRSARRRQMRFLLDSEKWDAISTCSHCFADGSISGS
ncbi:Radical SAM domain protein [Rhodomicrobium vannielii ATCC 17100]|uniref:Radical SAM domain protein n=1 Tax=Rhodomicrobium vannielii (strain ATCC 17100 / DSM 162 / LMG 4299 / NCIMB 10020 / ATH 3.1.1) TaxID=648757 RepID=E3I5G2_RHOVT|nr:tetratricopeptide repeat protein [Rhodomicrobium vannielii]ADP71683.1 Radical SAM domain protein [Rhodomicrobium vannielii ATCC 17100]